MTMARAVTNPKFLPSRARLVYDALCAAKASAEAARPGDDGGSANMDSPFLHSQRGLTSDAVDSAARLAGVGVRRYRSSMWNGWFVSLTAGQGAMRTRMAEAAARTLNECGEEASVYYQVD